MQAHKELQVLIAVLEAKNSVLQAQQGWNCKTLARLRRKQAKGNMQVLTKDCIISQEDAERELMAKGLPKLRNMQGNGQEKEKEEVAPPAAAVSDCNKASDDGNNTSLASAMMPSPPAMCTFMDELDDNKPLSAISDKDLDGFDFFNTVPVASSSHIKH